MVSTDSIKDFVCQNCFRTFGGARMPMRATDCFHRLCQSCAKSIPENWRCKVANCSGAPVPEMLHEIDMDLMKRFDSFAEQLLVPKCIDHSTRKRIICLDRNCKGSKSLCCNNCLTTLHKNCARNFSFDVERVVTDCKLLMTDILEDVEEANKMIQAKPDLVISDFDRLQRLIHDEWTKLWFFDFSESLDEKFSLKLNEDQCVHIGNLKLSHLALLLKDFVRHLATSNVSLGSPIQGILVKINSLCQINLAIRKVTQPHLTVTDPNTLEEKHCFCCFCGSDQFKYLAAINDALVNLMESKSGGNGNLVFRINADTKDIQVECRRNHAASRSDDQGEERAHPRSNHNRVNENGKPPRSRRIRKTKGTKPRNGINSKSKSEINDTLADNNSIPEKASPPTIQEIVASPQPDMSALSLLSDNLEFFNHIFEKEVTFTHIYSATRDEFQADSFHGVCGGREHTICVIFCEGEVVGGYSNLSWKADTDPKFYSSSKTFLFNLRTQKYYRVRRESHQYAIYCGQSYGPVFGDGGDLTLARRKDSFEVFSDLMAYKPEGCRYGGKELMGKKRRRFDKIDIFAVNGLN